MRHGRRALRFFDRFSKRNQRRAAGRKTSIKPRPQAMQLEALEPRALLSATFPDLLTQDPTILGHTAATVALDGAEISAFDAASGRLFVTGAAQAGNAFAITEGAPILQVIDLNAPGGPAVINHIDLSALGGGIQSVAVKNGLVAAAISSLNVTDPGTVAFFDAATLAHLHDVQVGSLPDMLTFTADGLRVLVANEGEPREVDPNGGVSIIDLSAGVLNASVNNLDFTAFNGREEELRAKGIRIFPGKTAGADFEPEYIAIAPDGSQAFVTLQEANAFAVIDLNTEQIIDVLPLGLKDFSRGPAVLEQFVFDNSGLVLGQTAANQDILLGGFSGLHYVGTDAQTGKMTFLTVPDRGPNGEPTNTDGDGELERPFALPDYQARVLTIEVDPTSGTVEVVNTTLLTRDGGATPITGLPNIPGIDEEPVDLFGNVLPYDPFGADLEGIVMAGDGTYWMVDEYRPAIYHFGADGALIDRFVAAGTGALGGQAVGFYGTEALPAEYSTRRANRGFEAVALDPDTGILYAFIQTPLANPNTAASNASDVIRVLGFDTNTSQVVSEYVYLLEAPDHRDSKVDKIGDAVYVGNGKFYVVERDSTVGEIAKKYLFEFDINYATNLRAPDAPALLPGQTLEQHTPDELVQAGIAAGLKIKVTNIPSLGYVAGDKVEGLALLPDGSLMIVNDNDFGLLAQTIPQDGSVALDPNPTQIIFGHISFAPGNQLDATDRDGPGSNPLAGNFQNWPIYGMYMPDAIASFSANGQTYYITANEGDDRGEDERIKDLDLDPAIFTAQLDLDDDDNAGRLGVSSIDGDLDHDGEYERLQTYGARSWTIWDSFGNLVLDSSDSVGKLTFALFPELFNADSGNPATIDSRSDNKGAEPEGVTTGVIGGRTYAFIGLERGPGGVLVYDVTDPTAPVFQQHLAAPGDISPEGVLFISAADSPTGNAMLAVTHEVSNTVSFFEFFAATADTTLTRSSGNIEIFLDGDEIVVKDRRNELLRQPADTLFELDIDAVDARNSKVIIDFAKGGVFALPGGLTLTGGAGKRDELIIRGSAENETFTFTAGGLDFVITNSAGSFNASTTGLDRLTVQTNGGDDVVRFSGVTLPDTFILDTGAGDDTVAFDDVDTNRDVRLNTGIGNDRVSLLNGNYRGSVTIDTGAGNDALAIVGSQIRRTLRATLGTGDDTAFLVNYRSLISTISGGRGNDVFAHTGYTGILQRFSQGRAFNTQLIEPDAVDLNNDGVVDLLDEIQQWRNQLLGVNPV